MSIDVSATHFFRLRGEKYNLLHISWTTVGQDDALGSCSIIVPNCNLLPREFAPYNVAEIRMGKNMFVVEILRASASFSADSIPQINVEFKIIRDGFVFDDEFSDDPWFDRLCDML